MTETATPTPPDGFELAANRGAFAIHNGPFYYEKDSAEGARQAFFAEARHTNGYGLVHGGMISAFLDGTMSQAVRRATGKSGVTVQFSLSYLHMARPGEWLISEAKVVRSTRDIVFVEGRVVVGDLDVVRASAVFKLMHDRNG